MSRQNSIRTGMDVLNLGIERLCEEGRRIKAEEERRQKTLDLVDELDRVFGDNFHRRITKACMVLSYSCNNDCNRVTGVVFPLSILKEDKDYFLRVMTGVVERDGKLHHADYMIDVSKISDYRRLEIPD